MVTLQRFIYPETLREALDALSAGREKARAIAGGTSLVFHRGRSTETYVDITRLGMNQIVQDQGRLELGACLRLQGVVTAAQLQSPGLVALSEAASSAGSRGVRNAVTLGGSIAGYKRWSDPPIALMALDATVQVEGPNPREVALTDLLESHPLNQLEPGELITAVLLDLPAARTGSAFVKLSRTEVDYALTSAAAQVVLDDAGRVADVSLALGAVRHLPTDATDLASDLLDAEPTEALLDQVAARITDEIEPGQDMRVSTGYLARVAGVTARDALAQALRRAGQEENNA
jgi:aerobic carbon-monoxide dehydrogenase medium subunit